MSELRGFEAVNDLLAESGGSVLGISVDPPDVAKKYVATRHHLNYDILCDTDRRVIHQYGLVHKNAGPDVDIAIPANILLDQDGSIVWRHTPKRIQERLNPADVMIEVRKLLDRG